MCLSVCSRSLRHCFDHTDLSIRIQFAFMFGLMAQKLIHLLDIELLALIDLLLQK